MSRFIRTILILPALCLSLAAQEVPPAEAVALVKDAIAFAKANGKLEAFKEFTRKGGKFTKHDGDLYIWVYDMEGKVLAHGQDASRVGANQLNAKDPNGVEYIKERINLAKTKGKGWHTYQYLNRKTKQYAPRSSYIEVWENMIFGTGIVTKK